jgi:hypothetical protein
VISFSADLELDVGMNATPIDRVGHAIQSRQQGRFAGKQNCGVSPKKKGGVFKRKKLLR